MIVTNKQAFSLALELGLVISVWNPLAGCEAMRGFPVGGRSDDAPVDLTVTPQMGEDCEYETVSCVALTDDGRAFLALLADEIPPTVRTPYN
jgi:hypothetical protein